MHFRKYFFINFFLLLGNSLVFSQTQCIPAKIIIDGVPVDAVSIDNDNTTGLKLPFWVSAGSTIEAGNRVVFISAIEFTEINGTSGSQLEYSRVVKIVNAPQTVPVGKVWKIESIIKQENTLFSTIVASNSGSACVGDSVKLQVTAVQGATYSWVGPNGFSSSVASPTVANVTSASAGVYVVTATVNGCSVSVSTNVQVHANPVATFTVPSQINQQTPATFTPTNGTLASYTWSFVNGTPATSSATTPSVTWASAGTNAVSLTVVDGNGCTATSQQNITVQACMSGSQTFNYTGAIVNFVVPACVTSIVVDAYGAQGGNSGGLGVRIQGTVSVTPGETLKILVGGAGETCNSSSYDGGGGGGGTFLVRSTNTPLIIAGGGGGYTNYGATNQMSGQSGQSGGASYSSNATNGNGGAVGGGDGRGSGGGGLLTNGASSNYNGSTGGFAFVNGGAGGQAGHHSSYTQIGGNGGFGGGGGAWNDNVVRSGGGGGYSGGQGGGWDDNPSGAGGGSYNAGTNQTNTSGVRLGNGMLTITW